MNNSNDFEAIFPEENEEKALTDSHHIPGFLP